MAFFNIVLRARSAKTRDALLGQLSDGWGENGFSFTVLSDSEATVIADIDWVDTGLNTIDSYGKVLADD